MVIYDHAAKYAPWFPDLSGEPEFLKLKLVNGINDQESNTFLIQSGEDLSLKKVLLTLDKIVHSRHKD